MEFDLAVRAAREAGALLRETMRKTQTVLLNEGRDIKIQADRDAEAQILSVLEGTGHPVLAEESGEHGTIDDSSPYWVIDPLDGTMNFARNIPMCCVSVALCIGREPVLGVIYDFNRDECFTGGVEHDASCGTDAVHVSAIEDPEKGILSTGVPTKMSLDEASIERFATKVSRFKKVRMIGSAAMSLALVAAGRVEAYSEEGIMFWDVAGGVALVRAAGGVAEMKPIEGTKWGVSISAAANRALMDTLDV